MSAPILILDDALSQVDTQTAGLIQSTIRGLSPKRTVVMVSHRLSHVRHADLIIVLESGHMIQSGSHERLMATEGYYSRMYRWQEVEEELNRK